jgi:hypothetical protein
VTRAAEACLSASMAISVSSTASFTGGAEVWM